jgi:hypothetical protein
MEKNVAVRRMILRTLNVATLLSITLSSQKLLNSRMLMAWNRSSAKPALAQSIDAPIAQLEIMSPTHQSFADTVGRHSVGEMEPSGVENIKSEPTKAVDLIESAERTSMRTVSQSLERSSNSESVAKQTVPNIDTDAWECRSSIPGTGLEDPQHESSNVLSYDGRQSDWEYDPKTRQYYRSILEVGT